MAEDKKYFDVVNELRRVKPYADIDGLKFFNSVQEGLEATRGLRLEGKSFYVIENGKRVEYIFEGGIEDSNLKKVEVSAGGEVNIGSISTTQTAEQLNALADGMYFANSAGIYNISIANPTTGVTVANGKTTVDSGYSVSFNKKGNIWSLASSVSIPAYDDSELRNVVNSVSEVIDKSINLLGSNLDDYNLNVRVNDTLLSPLTSNSGNTRVVSNKPILLKKNTTYTLSGAIEPLVFKGIISPTEVPGTGSLNGVTYITFESISNGYRFKTPSNIETPYFFVNLYLTTDRSKLIYPTQLEEGNVVTDYEDKGSLIKSSAIPELSSDKIIKSDFKLQDVLHDKDISFFNCSYLIENNGITKFDKIDTTKPCAIYFSENITKISFKINKLWDNNNIALIGGIGKENDVDVLAMLSIYGTTSQSTGDVININTTNTQINSINGAGRLSPPYTSPENQVPKLEVNDVITYEITEDKYLKSTIFRNGIYINHFLIDTKGLWVSGNNRLGWNQGLRLGIASRFANTNTDIIKDIKILNYKDKELLVNRLDKTETVLEISNTPKKSILFIGDSITEMDVNNGKGYVSFLNKDNNFNVINKGYSGWTLYKLWRDKSLGSTNKTGWDLEVPQADLVVIFAGTNDFDTNFQIPTSDQQMDTLPHPHPRFGNFDKESVDYKDPHTTLGSLRLIIEYIYANNVKGCKILVVSPMYREFSKVNSGTIEKLLINSEGKTIYDYSDAISDVAKEYNIPYINSSRDLGINNFNISYYTYDLLHLNEQGGIYVGNYIRQHLNSLI